MTGHRMYVYLDQLTEIYKRFNDNVFTYDDIKDIDGYDERCHKALMCDGSTYEKVRKYIRPPQPMKLSETALKYIEKHGMV